MLFHTWTFLLFIAVVLPVLFALRSTRLWIAWLLLASYTFYGWWNPYYLILVFYSTLLDFIVGQGFFRFQGIIPPRGALPGTFVRGNSP